jgi:hypothetical protein
MLWLCEVDDGGMIIHDRIIFTEKIIILNDYIYNNSESGSIINDKQERINKKEK